MPIKVRNDNNEWIQVSDGADGSAGQVNVSADNTTDNTYHLTFVSGTSGNQDLKVSVGATIRNNVLSMKAVTAKDNTSPLTLMNQSTLVNGGLEIMRGNQSVTAGGPFIDFSKNAVNYPNIVSTSIDTTNYIINVSTNIIQREWVSTNVTSGSNVITGPTHNLDDGDPVRYIGSTNNQGGATPADNIGGITPGITYYAVETSGQAFRLSATEADAKSASPTYIDITSAGSGTHTFKLGTLNTADYLVYKGATSGNDITGLPADNLVFVVKVDDDLNKFKIATSAQNALTGTTINFGGSPSNTQEFDVAGTDFDARIQLDSAFTESASIRFRTPIPGTSLPSAVGKSQVRMEVTREGAVVSGIMTVAHSSDRLDGTLNYIQAGIGTHFIREADSPDELVLTRDYRSKMIVFAKDINASDTKTVRINHGVFGYGDSITFYNASDHVCSINANGADVRIYLAGTNVVVKAGTNDGEVHLSSHAMATLTFAYNDGTVDEFVITGGGVYV